MFVSNPFFIGDADVVLTRQPLTADLTAQLQEPVGVLLQALQLIGALRTLQDPTNGRNLHDGAARILEGELAQLLQSAATLCEPPLATLLTARSEAFLSGNYESAARQYASSNELPLEFVAGALPSWRFPGHPRLYTGLLAIPRQTAVSISLTVDDRADAFLLELCEQQSLPPITRSATPPFFVLADLLAIGGDAMSHPIHIGNFFPNDEGIFKQAGRGRSVLYGNLYTHRFLKVSASLAERAAGSTVASHLPDDHSHAEKHLVAWFRGHDLGHLYFDPLCRELQGMPRFQRYILQETLADLFGLLLAISIFADDNDCPDLHHASATFVAEMLRYARRDPALFPDAAAAWIQFLYAADSQVFTFDDATLDIRIADVASCLRELFSALLGQLCGRETVLLQAMLDDCERARLEGTRGSALRALLHHRLVYTDVDPIFATADVAIAASTVTRAEMSTPTRAQPPAGRPSCYCVF